MPFFPASATTEARRLVFARTIRGFADGLVSVTLASYLDGLGFSGFEIGAIVTAQQAYFQKTAGTGAATYGALATLKSSNLLDITEAEIKWTFATANVSATGYRVTATLIADNSITVQYDYDRTTGGVFTP